MGELEILNVHEHAGVRVAPPSAGERHFVQIVTSEFESTAARFPILFCKNPETGAFYAGAMLGFKPRENLALGSADEADAGRLCDVTREGFYIVEDNIAIDRSIARFGSEQGSPLFDEDDRPAATLRRARSALAQLHDGLPKTEQFLNTLIGLRVIEPIDLSFSFDDGEQLVLEGLYTVSRDALAELDDATALTLFRQGALAHAYAAIASLQHIPRLARLRNDRLTAA